MKTNKENQSQIPLSERMLPFPNMTMMPRSVHKLPYHAPVTSNELHPDSRGKKSKKKKSKNKSKSTKLDELRMIIRKMIWENQDPEQTSGSQSYKIGEKTKKGWPIFIIRNERETLFGYWPTLEDARVELTKLVNMTK